MVLKICLALLVGLIFYWLFILRPQIRELKRKLSLPEFQGTAHQQTMEFSFQRLQKKRLNTLISFQGTPHQLALAFGLGVFLGIIPGTGAIAAAAMAALFRLNLPVMVAGALLTNPITTPFVYACSYFLGHWLLGDWLPAGRISRILLDTLAGNLVLAVSLGLIGYLLVLGAVIFIRNRRKSRVYLD